jgi:hypothetical protein
VARVILMHSLEDFAKIPTAKKLPEPIPLRRSDRQLARLAVYVIVVIVVIVVHDYRKHWSQILTWTWCFAGYCPDITT